MARPAQRSLPEPMVVLFVANVPVSETLRMADGLPQAGKAYDLFVLPGRDHGISNDAYGRTTIRRYLQEHLLSLREARQP